MLLGRGDITPNPAKDLSPPEGMEGPGDLLLGLDHADITLGLIVVERHPEVVHEAQYG